MLWTLRYKPGIGSVRESLIETRADDFGKAEQIGKAWCDSKPGHRYIGIERSVVADERILKPAEVEGKAPLKPVEPERALATSSRIGA